MINPTIIKDLVVLNGCVEYDLLKSKTRKRHVVDTRKVYYTLCRKFTKYSLQSIGDCIEKDHATVLSGLKSFKNLYGGHDFKEASSLYDFLDKKLYKMLNENNYELLSSYKDIDNVKQYFDSMIFKKERKFEKVIFLKNKMIDRLSENDVLKDISKLPVDEYNEFMERARIFLKVKKAMRSSVNLKTKNHE